MDSKKVYTIAKWFFCWPLLLFDMLIDKMFDDTPKPNKTPTKDNAGMETNILILLSLIFYVPYIFFKALLDNNK